ncbi:hypothetical protein [Magnetococcus sp. PR-3]|uniref:hypothetical protein n=1 Tax=Magnetococcus sp. PR-3 TaxID=3120355 RepID=UPI002FCE0C1D
MSTYQADRKWSDRFLPTIQQIVGPLLMTPAPMELDVNEATDLMVLTARDMRIACRIRRAGYADRYGHEFTMRSRRHDLGGKTEINKIAEGFGDWMFYGHALDEISSTLKRWMVIDLDVWRQQIKANLGTITWEERRNRDQETSIVSFDVRTFPAHPPILIAEGKIEVCRA